MIIKKMSHQEDEPAQPQDEKEDEGEEGNEGKNSDSDYSLTIGI